MPLSEHEQRLLEQMERALYAEDPKLATTLRGGGLRSGGRSRLAMGVVAVLVGIGGLLGGVATAIPAIGVVGFIVVVVGAWLILMAFRAPAEAAAVDGAAPQAGAAQPTKARKKSTGGAQAGFMGKVEDRWKKRREGNGDF